ncbi:MAG: glycosyltransferase family 39 protein [Anaerolineales bacterium]
MTPRLSADWIWGLSWEENAAGGALPNRRLLLSSRVITTALLPIALFFLYKAIQNTYSNKTALITVILLGLNPLFLLHGRRAMNEAAALAGICFFLWAISQEKIRPWLVGIAMAAAFNAKQSAIALLPIGIIAVCKPFKIRSDPNSIAKRIVVFGLFFTVITFMLNPFFWKHPLRAALASREITAELQANQLNDYYPRQEDAKKQTIPYQALALFSNLYYSQPSTADVGNYLAEIESQEEQYFKIPLHNLGRSLIPAAVFLILSLSGFMIGALRLKSSGTIMPKPAVLFLLATIIQFFTILFLLPLPWQRYVVPLLPFTCLWTAVGLSPIFEILKLKQSPDVKH